MANCGRCKLHYIYESELKGLYGTFTLPYNCTCDNIFKHAQNFHDPCLLGRGNQKFHNHNCPYFDPLLDEEPSQKRHTL